MTRGLTTNAVICPKVAWLADRFGIWNWAWLKVLKNSARNISDWPSRIANCFATAISQLFCPGPRTKRPRRYCRIRSAGARHTRCRPDGGWAAQYTLRMAVQIPRSSQQATSDAIGQISRCQQVCISHSRAELPRREGGAAGAAIEDGRAGIKYGQRHTVLNRRHARPTPTIQQLSLEPFVFREGQIPYVIYNEAMWMIVVVRFIGLDGIRVGVVPERLGNKTAGKSICGLELQSSAMTRLRVRDLRYWPLARHSCSAAPKRWRRCPGKCLPCAMRIRRVFVVTPVISQLVAVGAPPTARGCSAGAPKLIPAVPADAIERYALVGCRGTKRTASSVTPSSWLNSYCSRSSSTST